MTVLWISFAALYALGMLCGPPQAFYYSGGGNKMQEIRLETREWEIFVN